MKIFRPLIASILIAVMMYGCSGNELDKTNNSQESFLKLIPIKDVNNSLRVTIINDNQNEIKSGSEVEIVIQNLSDQEIFFLPEDPLAIRVFINKNNDWIEIKNNDTYSGDGGVLAPKGQIASSWKTGVRPVFEANLNIREQVPVRILVVGEFMSNGEITGVPVAAYVDLLIQP